MADRQLSNVGEEVRPPASSPCYADAFTIVTPITFYNHPVSNYGAKVAIVLRHKGLAFDERLPPGGYGSADYKAIVPAGTIPAIVDGGLVLSESETINEYLDEAYPEPPMLPGRPPDRARVRLLARFHDLRLEPPVRTLFPQLAPRVRDADVVAAQVSLFNERLAQLDALALPRPYLGGETLTLADCAYPATLMLAEMILAALGHGMAVSQKLSSWRTDVEAHPAVAPVLATCRNACQTWLDTKLADV